MDRLRVGASIDKTPVQYARDQGHDAMTAWLERIQRVGWKRYLSGPRYKLVGLRLLVARGRAQRQHPFFGKEQLMDLLFPGDQPPPPPPSYAGPRPGRVFKSGAQGLGYYVDVPLSDARPPPPPQAKKQARRQPRLPDDVFSIIARYYWGGGMSVEEEIADAAEKEERAAQIRAEESYYDYNEEPDEDGFDY